MLRSSVLTLAHVCGPSHTKHAKWRSLRARRADWRILEQFWARSHRCASARPSLSSRRGRNGPTGTSPADAIRLVLVGIARGVTLGRLFREYD